VYASAESIPLRSDTHRAGAMRGAHASLCRRVTMNFLDSSKMHMEWAFLRTSGMILRQHARDKNFIS
jgi:hypothetical protein